MKVIKSPKTDKKWRAVFSIDGKEKTTDFGQAGAEDYTIHKNKERRERYRARHQKDLKTKDPTRAGHLSFYILWGDSTSLRKNITDYKKRFDL